MLAARNTQKDERQPLAKTIIELLSYSASLLLMNHQFSNEPRACSLQAATLQVQTVVDSAMVMGQHHPHLLWFL